MSSDAGFFENAIQKELKIRIEVAIPQAVEAFEKRLREEAGRVALSILKHYEISQMGEMVTITVRHVKG